MVKWIALFSVENKGVIVIFRKLEVGLYASNCYITGCEATKEGMIVDPGAEAKQVLKAVNELELDIK